MIVIYIGIFIYGLFCTVRPDYLVKRKYKKENREETELDPKDVRFFRMFGLVVMALMAGALAVDLLL
ncbi:MAG: hypothetical protein LUE91_05830 [Oscillospiraceae bacterium]|nr:hypothetical protein [Oscillospiraceae bacterium]